MNGLTNLIAADVWKWIIIGIVALIVISIIMHFVNRSFRIRYNLNLFWGGLLMLITIGCVVGGYFLVQNENKIGYALFALAAILVILTLVYDCKKCGGVGVLAFFCQLIFSVGSLLLLLEFFNKGYVSGNAAEDRYVRNQRRKRGYDD